MPTRNEMTHTLRSFRIMGLLSVSVNYSENFSHRTAVRFSALFCKMVAPGSTHHIIREGKSWGYLLVAKQAPKPL